jgi:hypothetical protein
VKLLAPVLGLLAGVAGGLGAGWALSAAFPPPALVVALMKPPDPLAIRCRNMADVEYSTEFDETHIVDLEKLFGVELEMVQKLVISMPDRERIVLGYVMASGCVGDGVAISYRPVNPITGRP